MDLCLFVNVSCVHSDSAGPLPAPRQRSCGSGKRIMVRRVWKCHRSHSSLTVGETVILLTSPLHLYRNTCYRKMGVQQNDSLADGCPGQPRADFKVQRDVGPDLTAGRTETIKPAAVGRSSAAASRAASASSAVASTAAAAASSAAAASFAALLPCCCRCLLSSAVEQFPVGGGGDRKKKRGQIKKRAAG